MIDARLLAILAAMTACTKKTAPVPAPVIRGEAPLTTSVPPEGMLVHLSKMQQMEHGKPGDPGSNALQEFCANSFCAPSKLLYPTTEAVQRRAEGEVFYALFSTEMLGNRAPSWAKPGGLVLKVVSSDGPTQCRFLVDPTTGLLPDEQRCAVAIPGRPVGAAHRRPVPSGVAESVEAWLVLAADEDEAVESFRVHIEELQTLGCPIDLVERAREALCDEVRHRDLALEQAERLAGVPLQLGRRDTPARPRTEAMEILRAVALHGARNETLSMALLQAEATKMTSLERDIVEQIASDEVRHAALAWDTLHWAWPNLSDAEQAELVACVRKPLPLGSPFGRLSAQDRGRLEQTVRDCVIEPLLEGLIATRPSTV